MAKTTMEKIERNRIEQEQLKNQEKELLKKHKKEERDAWTKRLCTRHGMMEKHMPDLIKITDGQFETFIVKAINTSFGRDMLAKIIKQAETTVSQAPAEQTETTSTSAPPNQADNAEATASGSSANPQNHARSGA